MYNQEIIANADAQITFSNEGKFYTVSLYSQKGLELIASLWLKLSCEYRLMYEPTWLGIPIIQLPDDIVMMQELIWKVRPDVIIECGLAHGGSAVLYASICELIGKGSIIGIDVEVRQYNRIAIKNHPLSKRIEIIEGSSIEEATVNLVRDKIASAETVMVVLDSNHSREHVLRELELYHAMVTPGSYLIVMDGAQAHVWEVPGCKRVAPDDNPLYAIREFLKNYPGWQIDEYYNRLHLTSHPSGYLRKLTAEESKRK